MSRRAEVAIRAGMVIRRLTFPVYALLGAVARV
jgi:hypothetical protein